MLRALKDRFYNNSTERETVISRGSLCTREALGLPASAHLLTTIVVVRSNKYNKPPTRIRSHRRLFCLHIYLIIFVFNISSC